MELLKSNFLMGGFVVGIFFSYILFNTQVASTNKSLMIYKKRSIMLIKKCKY